jgi:hypothetical protein
MIIKILKNTTAENIYLINMEIPALGQLNIEHTMWSKLIQNGVVFNLINSGAIVVNNGSTDLSIIAAIHHIYLFQEENEGLKHFSYRRILTGSSIIVPEEQQMTLYQDMKIDSGGEILIFGEVVIRP